MDSMRFEMILINLISNAIKYSRKGSQVELKVSVTDLTTTGEADVEVKVIDSGIGIPERE